MTRHLMLIGICALGLMLLLSGSARATAVNGATADLDMDITLTLSDGLQMTFVQGHGANGSYSYVYTDVSGSVQEDEDGENGWNDWQSYSASASTANGATNSSVTINNSNPGFDYTIAADTMVEGLASAGDYGLGLGYAYAWPDWLRTDHAGTATLTIDYTYTLDTTDTGYGSAYVFMNAFFADHPGTNYLTAQDDWSLGYGSNPDTTIVLYGDSIGPGDLLTVTDSVSWDVVIPNTDEPYNWWSIWSYGEVGVEVMVPEPISLIFFGTGVVGVFGFVSRKRMRRS